MTLDRHKLTHDIPRVPCPHCDKMFTTKKGLVNHIGIHTGEVSKSTECCSSSETKNIFSSVRLNVKFAEWVL